MGRRCDVCWDRDCESGQASEEEEKGDAAAANESSFCLYSSLSPACLSMCIHMLLCVAVGVPPLLTVHTYTRWLL